MKRRDEFNLFQTLLGKILNQKNPYWRFAGLVLVIVLIVAYSLVAPQAETHSEAQPSPAPRAIPPRHQPSKSTTGVTYGDARREKLSSDQSIVNAFRKRRSNIIVEGSGIILKNLPDDDIGDRHQKFIIKLLSGHTVQIAHNIDLAPRVPAMQGDVVEFKGEYEYSERGGVVHWTHHDPARRHEDGWIRHAGESYE